ncbi:MAG: DNA methyltransferase, partial [Spirochaetaceae bacterium]
MFDTSHQMHSGDARDLGFLADESVDLIVTSPPYPMIAMWDEVFRSLSPEAGRALDEGQGWLAFGRMHESLHLAWGEMVRVVRPGGIVAINIGDATRTVGDRFSLYPNHARVLTACTDLGLESLPCIIWRKPTNSPTKFMGSGMLPGGAYVTLEHEYILIFRKKTSDTSGAD